MPNRIIRDWTNSDKMNELSFQAEVFFTRLIMKVDDFGCFWADIKRLKGNLFILKLDSIRDADISRWMAECQKAGLIVVYEHEGKKYLQINDFNQRKREMRSQFPPCPSNDGQMTVKCPPEVEVEVEVEKKGNKGFRPPTKEDVCNEMAKSLDDFTSMAEAEKYMDYYTSNGWKVGKNSMKDWKSAVRNWIRNLNKFNDGKQKLGTSETRIIALKNF